MTEYTAKMTDTNVHDHGNEKVDSSVFQQTLEPKFWQELGKDVRITLQEAGQLIKDGILPKLDLGKNIAEFQIEAEAQQAAEIIARRGDLGTDYQRHELEKMFEEAKRNGTEKELLAAINLKLVEQKCPYRLTMATDLMQPNSWPGNRDTDIVRLVSTQGMEKTVDQMSVSDGRNINQYAD